MGEMMYGLAVALSTGQRIKKGMDEARLDSCFTFLCVFDIFHNKHFKVTKSKYFENICSS